jgi:hypothetical protein
LQLSKGLCKRLCKDILVEKVGRDGGEVGIQVLNILRSSYSSMMEQTFIQISER